MTLPRPEHPNPQFERERWLNLNGLWGFAFDAGRSGVQRGLAKSEALGGEIVVPFCPESELSGIAFRDFIDAVWYHRSITVPRAWRELKVLLHFGGADYATSVYIDGEAVGCHYGGSSAFSFDITSFVRAGEKHNLVVHVQDDVRTRVQPAGKQSIDLQSAGCLYTRTTGIWQTVWLEAASPFGLESCAIVPDLDNGRLNFLPTFFAFASGQQFRIRAYLEGALQGEAVSRAANGAPVQLTLVDPHPWSPQSPTLYDLTLEVLNRDGAVLDRVRSYTGLRKVHVEGQRIFLNNEPLYPRLVLDQGFYPTGIWTAPSEEALKNDIELGLRAGFNGARLHQKVFEHRFHYWADRYGYLTFAESPSWGLDLKSETAARNFLSEWREIVLDLRNHPSIIAWTPLNETWDISAPTVHRRLHVEAYQLTRALDASRPVAGASGGCQVKTDLYCVHIYEQDPLKLRALLTPGEKGVYRTLGEKEAPHRGEPYLVNEFGGIKWIPNEELLHSQHSWGYGAPPQTIEEFYERLSGQVNVILSLPHVAGYCYTQLTDVEQEQNGIYNANRSDKFGIERVREIFSRLPDEQQSEGEGAERPRLAKVL